jgi:hypothetical protein
MRKSVPSLGVAALVLGTGALLFGVSSWATVVAFVVVAAMLGGMTASRRDDEMIHRITATGNCLHCGYDLTGNVSGVCPECGGIADGR